MATLLVEDYRGVDGRFRHSAALAALLRHAGCVGPHDGRPWSEAMVFGLGAGYLVWNLQGQHSTVLTLGFHHRWNEPETWYSEALRRVGATGVWAHARSPRRARRALEACLRNGHPAVCWVDEFHLPYLHVDEAFEGCFGWVVTVYGVSDSHAQLDDVWARPLAVERARFDAARARSSSYRHRQLTVLPGPGCGDLSAAVRDAIGAHVATLDAHSTTLGLAALRKWARALADPAEPKSWARLFADGTRLASVFRAMREGIALRGMDGGGLRGLYADFLREAGAALHDPALTAIASAYDALASRWREVSLAAFPQATTPPAGHPFAAPAGHPFAGMRDLVAFGAALDAKFAALSAGDLAAASAADAEVARLNRQLDTTPPWTAAQQARFFRALGELIQALWFAEKQALAQLKRWLAEQPERPTTPPSA